MSGHVAARQQVRRPQEGMAAAQPAPANPTDVVEQLKQFAELRDQGILSEEEFTAQKAKLLNS
ncbi:MAG: SHOCT domain-containing protein [Acidimicrobiaceae bacterium]|nr:SHOCT domain-containing protein [Acidimicrobiaceae bacterium]